MRNIYIVNATQVVVSEAHPEGAFSGIYGYPKTFDSRYYNATEDNPDGDTERALRVAKGEYYSQLSALYVSDSRAMWTVTLSQANGQVILRESYGGFPDMTPESEPEPEESETPEEIPVIPSE